MTMSHVEETCKHMFQECVTNMKRAGNGEGGEEPIATGRKAQA